MKRLSTIYLCLIFIALCNKIQANNDNTPRDIVTLMNNEINLNNIDISLLENSVIYLSNQYRLEKGKHVVNYNKQLNHAAYIHSKQMVLHDFFDHINPYEKQFRDLDNRANFVHYNDYQTLSENIIYGYIDLKNVGTYKDLAKYIVNSFIESKGHRDNLLANDVDEIGCGIAFEQKTRNGYWYFYFTQDFGKRF